jgi:hypothetical protein
VRRLEHVRRADQVHPHRAHGALQHRVDARDRGEVDDVRRARGQLPHQRQVEHVAFDEAEVLVLGEIGPRQRVPVQVVEHHDLVLGDEPPRERGADEARTARHQNPFPAEHDRPVYPRSKRALGPSPNALHTALQAAPWAKLGP